MIRVLFQKVNSGSLVESAQEQIEVRSKETSYEGTKGLCCSKQGMLMAWATGRWQQGYTQEAEFLDLVVGITWCSSYVILLFSFSTIVSAYFYLTYASEFVQIFLFSLSLMAFTLLFILWRLWHMIITMLQVIALCKYSVIIVPLNFIFS